MAPLGFFRSNPADRAPSSPSLTSPANPSHAPFSDKDRDRFVPSSPPASPTKSKGSTPGAGTSSNRLRRLKSGSFSFGRSDSAQSSLKGVNELDDLGRLMPERSGSPGSHLERSRSTTVKAFRPRGASESSGDRVRPRMWFSRHKVSASALSDDEGDHHPRDMVISAPMPPIDGRPMKSTTVMEELAELQRKVTNPKANETDGSVSSASLRRLVEGPASARKEDVIQRPVTPPAILRLPSAGNYPTPLSPLKRTPNRARKSPHIAPLVFRSGATTSPAPSPTSAVDGSYCEQRSSITRMDVAGPSHQIRQSDSTGDPPMSALRPMPPSPGRSNLKHWQNRRPSNESTSSSLPPQGPLAQPFVHSAQSGDTPPRSISSDTSFSARSSPSSPEPISLEGQETEELRTFDDSEDSAVGIMLSSASSYRKTSGDETASRGTTATFPGYTIDVVCSEDAVSEAGDEGAYETIKWEVIIRKSKSTESQSTPLHAPTSPIALSRGHTTAIPPATASSINLSLALDRPTGKLVFISLPVDPQQTPHQRTRSRGGISGVKSDLPESPSASSARFQGAVRTAPGSTGKPTAVPSPFYSDESSAYPTSLSPPPPSLSASPRIGRFPSQRRKPPQQIVPGSPLHNGIPDSPRLVTPRSPPASPRDVFMQRRKASLQDGVLFTPDL